MDDNPVILPLGIGLILFGEFIGLAATGSPFLALIAFVAALAMFGCSAHSFVEREVQ